MVRSHGSSANPPSGVQAGKWSVTATPVIHQEVEGGILLVRPADRFSLLCCGMILEVMTET